jgi:hypothetical protein
MGFRVKCHSMLEWSVTLWSFHPLGFLRLKLFIKLELVFLPVSIYHHIRCDTLIFCAELATRLLRSVVEELRLREVWRHSSWSSKLNTFLTYSRALVMLQDVRKQECWTDEIPGSHGDEYEDDDGCLLDCCTVYSGRSLPTFQRCLLPPSSGLIALMMEAASISETSVSFYKSPRRNNPEDSHLLTRRRENLKSHREWRWLSSGMLSRVVWYKLTDVSQVILSPVRWKQEWAHTSG